MHMHIEIVYVTILFLAVHYCGLLTQHAMNIVEEKMAVHCQLLLLSLLWSLVEVHSQPAAPYVSFMGENLANHSYVDLTLVGTDGSDPGNNVRCHTDLSSCCSSSQGIHRGDWYFPDGSSVPRLVATGDIVRYRGAQRVDLHRRNNAMSPSGIYRCDIATDAVHDDGDLSVRETVYVGLYASGGNELIRCYNSKPLSLIIM